MYTVELEFNLPEEQLEKIIYDLYFTMKMSGYYLDPNPRRDLLGWLNIEVQSEIRIGEGMDSNIVRIGSIKLHAIGANRSMLTASAANSAIKVFWDYLVDALKSALDRTSPPETSSPADPAQLEKPPYLPKGKKLNEWKAVYRIVGSAWLGGGRSYEDFVKILEHGHKKGSWIPSKRTMDKIFKAAVFYKW